MARRLSKRNQKQLIAVLIILISWAYASAQQHGWIGKVADVAETNQPGLYSVTHFIDGDTIAVSMNGKEEKVRLVGVDTPETHKPNTPVQCYGPAAAAYIKTIIGTQKVRLVSDSLSTDRDRYNRLLRYVYLPDGSIVNEKLIQSGHGFYYPYFPFTKSAQFEVDQAAAMADRRGLWGNCSPTRTAKGGYLSNPQ